MSLPKRIRTWLEERTWGRVLIDERRGKLRHREGFRIDWDDYSPAERKAALDNFADNRQQRLGVLGNVNSDVATKLSSAAILGLVLGLIVDPEATARFMSSNWGRFVLVLVCFMLLFLDRARHASIFSGLLTTYEEAGAWAKAQICPEPPVQQEGDPPVDIEFERADLQRGLVNRASRLAQRAKRYQALAAVIYQGLQVATIIYLGCILVSAWLR